VIILILMKFWGPYTSAIILATKEKHNFFYLTELVYRLASTVVFAYPIGSDEVSCSYSVWLCCRVQSAFLRLWPVKSAQKHNVKLFL